VTTYVSVQGESCARLADLYESFRLRTKPSNLPVSSLADTTRCTTGTRKFGPFSNEKAGASASAVHFQLE
jgi:hypothetical protein